LIAGKKLDQKTVNCERINYFKNRLERLPNTKISLHGAVKPYGLAGAKTFHDIFFWKIDFVVLHVITGSRTEQDHPLPRAPISVTLNQRLGRHFSPSAVPIVSEWRQNPTFTAEKRQ